MSEENHTLTLRGSTELVTEFFEYCVNSIIYQRGIYPPEAFKRVPKYGLPMFVSSDDAVVGYLKNITGQLHSWLLNKNVQKLILVIKGLETETILERWIFDCIVDKTVDENCLGNEQLAKKSLKEITAEIQAIMRQISASVTFLPLLSETCSFDLLVYTDKGAEVPLSWEDSDPCLIKNAAEVQLRGLDANAIKVGVKVSYKVDEI